MIEAIVIIGGIVLAFYIVLRPSRDREGPDGGAVGGPSDTPGKL